MNNNPVKLTVYNVQGQLVETLLDRPVQAGNHTVRWEGKTASGPYDYHLQVGEQEQTGKMTLVK